MITPPEPDNEVERLDVLLNLNILDTDAEERFDRITRIAKKLFNVSIVLISLIDAKRQWFKSRQGLDVKETSRQISFCGHTILENKLMVVNDTIKDKRFKDNPLVEGEPHIRFYVGCPLKIKNAFNVGTLCFIDEQPRVFSEADKMVLRDLGDMVQAELESQHLAITDELTTLANRRGFLVLANYVFNVCKREKKPLTLLFFDLDKFKITNDTFGHAEGDNVLRVFSQVLRNSFRESDVIGRLGGDEFCVLLSGLTKCHAIHPLERFQMALETYQKNHNKIEYSVGCIQYDEKRHPTLVSMMDEADNDMYKNKQCHDDKLPTGQKR